MSGLVAEDASDLRRWMLSSAAVLAMYGALAASLVTWHQPDQLEAAEPSGAMVFDLAPLAAAPSAVPRDVAPGPEQTMSEARPAAPDDAPNPDETSDLPQAPNPDAAVDQPTRHQPDAVPEQQAAATTSAPAAASERIAPVAVAPTQGRPDPRDSQAVATWRSQVLAVIERNKRYPQAARARREQGVAQIWFTIDRKGLVSEARIARSSGSAALDAEALALLTRAQPFPAPPDNVPGSLVAVRLPIHFTVK